MPLKESIAFRLTLAVFFSVVLALSGLALITHQRLNKGLDEQALALDKLSENLFQERLSGDIALVQQKLDEFSNSLAGFINDAARRPDVINAVNSSNDVTVSERLKNVNKTNLYDVMLAFNDKGLVLGADTELNASDTSEHIKKTPFYTKLLRVLDAQNSRVKPVYFFEKNELSKESLIALGLPLGTNLTYLALYPVFDEFGEVIGALLGARRLKQEEAFLVRFAQLARVDVLIGQGQAMVSRTDKHQLIDMQEGGEKGLNKTSDGQYITKCTPYIDNFNLCVAQDAAILNDMRSKMFSTGAEQIQKLRHLLLIAGLWTLALLSFILFIVINSTMRGLSTLNRAAQDVAEGNMETQFQPLGVGEIRTLSYSFEKMLRHIRIYTQKIHHLAFYDEVTGLANRTKLSEEIIPHFKSEMRKVLIMVDIANFKGINDSYGLKIGDKLLHKTAERLNHVLRFYKEYDAVSNVTLSRLNGANFVAFFTTTAQDEALQDLCTIVASHLSKTTRIGTSRLNTSHPIGIYVFTKDEENVDMLISYVQLALEEAKKRGRNVAVFFDPKMKDAANKKQEIEHELKEALAQKALNVYYQPKVSCETGVIVGSEALVRWTHPRLGFISPGLFIPIAEEAGLIGEVGRFVLERAIKDTKSLLDKGHKICTSVNVSALQLEDTGFAEDVLSLLNYYDMPAHALELEITEGLAMRDSKGVSERITLLREAGVKFSMDDFGTGYSNLSQLSKMPIDVLKLDRSLIQDVHLDRNKQILARTILQLAKELNFKTVVEGVEKHEELNFCLQNGASSIQGFIFSPAVPLEKFLPFLEPADLKLVFKDVFEKTNCVAETLTSKAA
jgi:diguanylate cyclase (GGDEF)-like protein